MKCKICRLVDSEANGALCRDCSIAIEALYVFVEDMETYLKTADATRLEEHYSANMTYFVSSLSAYNRYVGVKNLVQEMIYLHLTDTSGGRIMADDVENNDPLKDPKIRYALASSEILESTYDPGVDDLALKPLGKLAISSFVLDAFGLNNEGFTDYLNAVFLYSMIVLIQEDIKMWMSGSEKALPRRGFYPLRLIAGAIRRAVNNEPDPFHVSKSEMYHASKGLTKKGEVRTRSQITGLDFQSKSIFSRIPDFNSNDKENFTPEFSTVVAHFANRIRERVSERTR